MNFLDGLYVIPIHPKKKSPLEPGWQQRVALYPERVDRWPGVTRWGAPTGPVNEDWILDVDATSGGLATLADLVRQHGPLPLTRTTRTARSGLHYWFLWDPERPMTSWVGRLPGIDTRGAGGQVLIPPTDGYLWESEHPLAHAPDWLYEALNVHGRLRTRGPLPQSRVDSERPRGLLADREGALRDLRRAEKCLPGQYGKAVFKLALRLVRGRGLDPDEAADLLERHYEPKCGPEEVAQEHGGTRRACQRAASHASEAPWGYTWYHGPATEVLLRSIRRYGPAGALEATVPYRVWPDGSMLQIDYGDGLKAAVRNVTLEAGGADPSLAEIGTAVQWWRSACPSDGDMPTPVALNDEPGPSLARLETAEGPTPAWDEFLTRLDSADVFLAWVWMLTLPKAGRQVLWLQGEGHDGKTQVSSVLTRALGRAATSADDTFTNESERWLGSQVYGKRLVVVDDTKMPACLRRGIVHRISGGSALKCEAKGVDGFDFLPNVAILCTSNLMPEIGDTEADRSRLLVVKVGPLAVREADYRWVDRLLAEFPQLLNRGRAAYERLAVRVGEPQLRLPPVVKAHVDEAAGTDGRAFGDVLELAGFTLDPALSISNRELLSEVRIEWKRQCALIEWLKAQGCERTRGAKGVRGWTGVGRVK